LRLISDSELDLTDNLTGKTLPIRLPAQRALMLLLSREDGRLLAHYSTGLEKQAAVPTPA